MALETKQANPELITESILKCLVTLHNLLQDKPLTWAYLVELHEADPQGVQFPLSAMRGSHFSSLSDEAIKNVVKVINK
jgi:hypothetical protein